MIDGNRAIKTPTGKRWNYHGLRERIHRYRLKPIKTDSEIIVSAAPKTETEPAIHLSTHSLDHWNEWVV